MEFIVLAHRDSKDVFILGGTDDIQVQLDDSIVSTCRINGIFTCIHVTLIYYCEG